MFVFILFYLGDIVLFMIIKLIQCFTELIVNDVPTFDAGSMAKPNQKNKIN